MPGIEKTTPTAAMRFSGFDYPDMNDIPQELRGVLDEGKSTWEAEAFGIVWYFATLEHWETREIHQSVANLDPLTKSVRMQAETLCHAIVKVKRIKDNKEFEFLSAEGKVMLRALMLSVSDEIVAVLHEAYVIGKRKAVEELDKRYPDLRKKIADHILGAKSGENSKSEVASEGEGD